MAIPETDADRYNAAIETAADLIKENLELKSKVRRLELAALGMFDRVKVGQVVAQLQMERDQARDELQSMQRTRHDAYAQCLAAMVLLERAVAVRIDDDWLKEARALLNGFKAAA